jgi:hypothetical protein
VTGASFDEEEVSAFMGAIVRPHPVQGNHTPGIALALCAAM